MNNKFLLPVLTMLTFSTCKAQTKCDELDKFIFTNTAQKNVYYEIHLMGKEAIPCLIDFIDTAKKSFVGFQDPSSSSIHSFNANNYIGIRAAYLIEFILSKDSVESVNGEEWAHKIKPYRIYNFGVIVKTKNNEPILEPLDYQDMKILKGIYLKWWNQNKSKPLEILRKEWKANKHILDNSNYKWI